MSNSVSRKCKELARNKKIIEMRRMKLIFCVTRKHFHNSHCQSNPSFWIHFWGVLRTIYGLPTLKGWPIKTLSKNFFWTERRKKTSTQLLENQTSEVSSFVGKPVSKSHVLLGFYINPIYVPVSKFHMSLFLNPVYVPVSKSRYVPLSK